MVVDDEPGMRHFLEKALESRYARVDAACSIDMAQTLFDQNNYSTIVLDVNLSGKSGLDWLNQLRQAGYEGDVILITGYADMDTAIAALRAGAQDFLQKPFRIDQLWYALDRAADQNRLKRENFVLRRAVSTLQQNEQVMLGDSTLMRQLRKLVAKVAPTDSTVLLTGESGSGKEVLARTLHSMSHRSDRPFVPINCGAISPELIESELFGHAKGAFTGATESHQGLFYYAQGGTLFLDEIGELPLSMQTKLLRVLEDRRIRPVGSNKEVDVDVRIVAATNVNLEVEVKRGRFRPDLFYRLQVMPIEMPPLRARPDDVGLLANYFMQVFSRKLRIEALGVSPDMLARMQAYDWPGNVRELRNFIERSLILGYFPKEDLPLNLDVEEVPDSPVLAVTGSNNEPEDESLERVEKAHILRVLQSCQGNKSEAARRLGVSRKTLERKCMAWSQE